MKSVNVLVLAYLGDAIYEMYIRKYLILNKYDKVGKLQKKSIDYVSAKAQSKILIEMLNGKFLKEEEEKIVKRARNHKSHKAPKGTSIVTYKNATGLEALIGKLYLDNNINRIEEIMKYIVGE